MTNLPALFDQLCVQCPPPLSRRVNESVAEYAQRHDMIVSQTFVLGQLWYGFRDQMFFVLPLCPWRNAFFMSPLWC